MGEAACDFRHRLSAVVWRTPAPPMFVGERKYKGHAKSEKGE
jgi:hypothetical protein